MKTITFYSFKGGVGRSLTLSNMALWLADEMKAKVCVIDFDLEAPGLPYKFDDLQNPEDQERLAHTEGIVEYVDEFNQTGFPPADFTRFYLSFTTAKGNPISLIPAGNLQQADYWRKLFDINWQQLFEYDASTGYSKGLLLLEDLKGRIEAELAPDFLLIDSRTGLTETASITLKLMADKAILVGINNRENQDGLFWVLRSLYADPSSRNLPYHLVLNRVPMQYGTGRKEIDPREKMLRESFLKRFESLASLDYFAQRFSIIHADDEQAFEEKLQAGFYVESQPKVQIRKDYWDVFTQVTKEYFTDAQWNIFDRKRKAYELYYKAKFDTTDVQTQIDLINEAIGYCDDDAFLYNYRFILVYNSGNKETVHLDLEKAVVLKPDDVKLRYNLGVIYARQKKYDLAIEAYYKAIKIDPSYNKVWHNLSNNFINFSYQQKEPQKSETLQKALEAAQKSQELGGKVYNLSCVYSLFNDKRNALYWLQQALERKDVTVEHVQKDRDFDSLREDEDFKALLAQFSS
ncbi:AAA family ATPase [Runella sp. MFBS21]|uniref:KGGVGR-motif variant AAA ATPase n=1 Tax=Runella sp. MFBS21 TaxID=3034018 RepID=UPI0023F8EDDA|nr:tetratricopeptide repeat protein [Runella sp. MFBS21]MDF7817001.1 AAA family ATPase [Runella sp. MFBS21]